MLSKEFKRLRNANKRELRNFGLTIGGVLLVAASYLFLTQRIWVMWLLYPGAALTITGVGAPRALRWIYIIWMGLAIIVGSIISSLLLTLCFYLIVTPMGALARVRGKDFLSRRVDKAAGTYWLVRNPERSKTRSQHEQQF